MYSSEKETFKDVRGHCLCATFLRIQVMSFSSVSMLLLFNTVSLICENALFETFFSQSTKNHEKDEDVEHIMG